MYLNSSKPEIFNLCITLLSFCQQFTMATELLPVPETNNTFKTFFFIKECLKYFVLLKMSAFYIVYHGSICTQFRCVYALYDHQGCILMPGVLEFQNTKRSHQSLLQGNSLVNHLNGYFSANMLRLFLHFVQQTNVCQEL